MSRRYGDLLDNKEPTLVGDEGTMNQFHDRNSRGHSRQSSPLTRANSIQLESPTLRQTGDIFSSSGHDVISVLGRLKMLNDSNEYIPQSPRKWGFLGLPAETRLQIYDLLLLNRRPDGKLHAINIVDSSSNRNPYYEPFAIYYSGDKNGRVPARGPVNSCDYIEAAILRTCKQIAFEGAYVLYSHNVFAINLSREAIVPVNSFPFKRRARAVMKVISKTQHNSETNRMILPEYVNELSTFAFLQQIGPRNAANIENIEFFAQHTDEYKRSMPIVTEVLKQRAPGLRTASFYVVPCRGDLRAYDKEEYESAVDPTTPMSVEEPWSFDPNSPSIGTGSWPEVRDAITHFCNEFNPLDALKYGGCWTFASMPPQPYVSPSPDRVHFDGNTFDGYHWRLAMNEGDLLEEQIRKKCSGRLEEMGMTVREVICPNVINFRRNETARSALEGGIRASILRFLDGIFWVDA